MKKSTKISLIVFIITFIILGIGGTLINMYPPNTPNDILLSKFEYIIGEENYKELTDNYKILFIDNNKNSGEIYNLWKQIRIDSSMSEKEQLIALCHEYGHYLTIKYDLTNNKEYNLTGKYVYLYPDSSIWGQANAWFLLKYDSNYSKFIECTNYSGYYKASVGLNVTSVDFYRMNPNNTFENITSGSENLDTVKWNLITGITLSNENYFKINGWSSYKTTAKLVNEPDYILE